MGRFRDTLKGRHLMVDGETFSLAGNALFVQLAALEWWPAEPERECRLWSTYIDLPDSIRVGRHFDGNTILWWMDDDHGAGREARQALVRGLKDEANPPISWREALEGLDAFINAPTGRGLGHRPQGLDGIWSHGAGFDVSRLETGYGDLRLKCPWSHNIVLDTRTVFKLAGKRMQDLIKHEDAGLVLHDARADVEVQVRAIHAALDILDGEG